MIVPMISAIGKPLEESGEETTTNNAQEDTDLLAGHSYHGEAFNEGPRQSAILMPNLGSIDFPTSTENKNAQKFIEQGIIQLHGFWYLEAERSFRQASMIDPELAIAYWGMAMANQNNADRARGFIDEALSRIDTGADEREKLYINALNQLIPAEKKDSKDSQNKDDREQKKQRAERYINAMEKVLHDFPNDIEAKAFIAVQMWVATRNGVKITSRYAVDALLSEVFQANPNHPAHHYRIHLWDRNRPENALTAAAQCGPSSPGIAHMWHMPGHIYSGLKRYQDAAWQQEASARVDHAHMIQTRLMPDQIHNFAHNNEWLIRNLVFVGRVKEAIEQSKNLISLPQHPRYNSLEKSGSQKYGRQRLLQVLTEYELWKELLTESRGPYLAETGNTDLDNDRSAWIGVAHYMLDQQADGDKILNEFRAKVELADQQIKEIEQIEKDKKEAAEENADSEDSEQKEDAEQKKDSEGTDEEAPSKEELKKQKQRLEPLVARMECGKAAADGNLEKFKEFEKKARLEVVLKARWLARSGDRKEAIEITKKQVSNDPSQVRPLVTLTQLLETEGLEDEAKERFERLRTVAGHADLETPMLKAVTPLAQAANAPTDWRLPEPPAKDLGPRPELKQLGPFRWEPYQAPAWRTINSENQVVSNESHQGKPTVMIFYLGFGCLHCVEQLHAFSPMIDDFKSAGIDVIAISTEALEELKLGIKNFEEPIKIPLLSDGPQEIFKSFRCWDDFENQPLHGTFLIDGSGRVRWQDISYEPFNEPQFLLDEAKRLLQLP